MGRRTDSRDRLDGIVRPVTEPVNVSYSSRAPAAPPRPATATTAWGPRCAGHPGRTPLRQVRGPVRADVYLSVISLIHSGGQRCMSTAQRAGRTAARHRSPAEVRAPAPGDVTADRRPARGASRWRTPCRVLTRVAARSYVFVHSPRVVCRTDVTDWSSATSRVVAPPPYCHCLSSPCIVRIDSLKARAPAVPVVRPQLRRVSSPPGVSRPASRAGRPMPLPLRKEVARCPGSREYFGAPGRWRYC
jgi:hypothetical protein